MKANTTLSAPEADSLLRKAASYGPGIKGQRTTGTSTEKSRLSKSLSSLGLDPPPYLGRDQTWVDRKAKLFESGDYPDKGISVSEQTLERLAESFELPVPVLIEHAKSPLQLGYLTDVRAEGKDLFGTITLTKEANELIEASGAHALSLGLSSDLTSIQEVSLVKKPRVPSARLFTGEVFSAEPDWKSECESLRREIEATDARKRIELLLEEGRLLPVQLPFATVLVAQCGAVEFDGESVPVQRLVLSMLELAPKHGMLQEHAATGKSVHHSLDPDERAFYDRYFSGLSLEDIAKNRQQK